MISLKNSVIVFDLDDTLYKESDYQLSGYQFIIETIHNLYDVDISLVIQQAITSHRDVLSEVCQFLNLPQNAKNSLLWLYRNHIPTISLDENIKNTLTYLKQHCLAIAILTDGRSLSQRAKIKALGLSDYDLYISEEWGSDKPDDKRFIAIMNKYPLANQFVYIGDNVKKDFITPNKLQWLTIGLKDDGRNIHCQQMKNIKNDYFPDYWVDNLEGIFFDKTKYYCTSV